MSCSKSYLSLTLCCGIAVAAVCHAVHLHSVLQPQAGAQPEAGLQAPAMASTPPAVPATCHPVTLLVGTVCLKNNQRTTVQPAYLHIVVTTYQTITGAFCLGG